MANWINAEIPSQGTRKTQLSDEESDKFLYPQPNQEPSMSYNDPMPSSDPNRVNDFPNNQSYEPLQSGQDGADFGPKEGQYASFFINLNDTVLKDFAEAYKDLDHPYHGLAKALLDSYEQASAGKGKERHAQGQSFDDQPINTFTDSMGTTAGLCFQVQKKTQESLRLDDKAAIHELRGAIVYASAMINWRQNNPKKETCHQYKVLNELVYDRCGNENLLYGEQGTEFTN